MSYGDAVKQLQLDVNDIKKRLRRMELRFTLYVGFLLGVLYVINRLF